MIGFDNAAELLRSVSREFTLGCAMLALLATGQPAAAQLTYGGSCVAACLRRALPPSEQCFVETGELPAGGGILSDFEPSVVVGLDVYAAANLSSTASAGSGTTDCSSSQDDVSAFAGLLVAASVRADAQANCGGVSGSSTIQGLVLGGQSIEVTGAANQVVNVPGVATLVINEQIEGASGTQLTVNALRLTLSTGDELVLCTAVAEVTCSVPVENANWSRLKADFR